jgi:hypothetical protein
MHNPKEPYGGGDALALVKLYLLVLPYLSLLCLHWAIGESRSTVWWRKRG